MDENNNLRAEPAGQLDADVSKLIELDDPTLDAKDPFTRVFLLAEYWQREARKARASGSAQQASDRCDHGVWAGDHCYQCATQAPTVGAEIEECLERDCHYFGKPIPNHCMECNAGVACPPNAGTTAEVSEVQLRHTLKEITLCYPWGTGRKLVREGVSLKWVSVRESTGSNTMLADMNNNLVNSAIAATVAAISAMAPQDSAKEGGAA